MECVYCWTTLNEVRGVSSSEYKGGPDCVLYCPNCNTCVRIYRGQGNPWRKAKGFIFKRCATTGKFYQDEPSEDDDELFPL